ncbi:MAG: alpha/beta hydrolase family protein [Promethearchaeota archaeon]
MKKKKEKYELQAERIEIPRRNGKILVGHLYISGDNKENKIINTSNSKNIETNKNINNSNRRLAVLVHGFPGDKIENKRFPALAQELNKEGIDVIAFDLAGYGENERESILLSKQIENVEDVSKWAISKGYSRIGTVGLSLGGPSTLLAEIPERRAAIFWAPAFNFSKILGGLFNFLVAIRFFISKKPMKFRNKKHPKVFLDKEFFDELKQYIPSKVNEKLKEFRTPCLILQGTTDPIIRPRFHKKVLNLLPETTPKQLIKIKFAGHNFRGKKLQQFVRYTVDFFKKYL